MDLVGLQNTVAVLLVVACSAYAVWSLMPSALRRGLAGTLLRWSWPSGVTARLRRAAAQSSGCGSGCKGCGGDAAPQAKGTAQVVRFHPRQGK